MTAEKAVRILLLLTVGCGGAPPSKPADLPEKLAAISDADALETKAPNEWLAAKTYFEKAEQMEKEGEDAESKALETLGRIQLRIARAVAKTDDAKKRRAQAMGEHAVLEKEKHRLSAELDRLEARMERERIRSHLTGVISETRLRAAAQEEREERSMKQGDKKALTRARQRVAKELMAGAYVWKALVELLGQHGTVSEAALKPVSGSVALAESAMVALDLAGVQAHVEAAAIEARRLVESALGRPVVNRSLALSPLLEEMTSAGYEALESAFGAALVLEGVGIENGANASRLEWRDAVARIGAQIKSRPQILCLVVAAAPNSDNPGTAEAQSEETAAAVRDALIQSGVSADRIRAFGAGASAPFSAFASRHHPVAIVLLDLPQAP